jgi:hypothetical protein
LLARLVIELNTALAHIGLGRITHVIDKMTLVLLSGYGALDGGSTAIEIGRDTGTNTSS